MPILHTSTASSCLLCEPCKLAAIKNHCLMRCAHSVVHCSHTACMLGTMRIVSRLLQSGNWCCILLPRSLPKLDC